ncbi:MAG: UDP-N-acetylglucosamine 1-carboxyvinyltransferase [Clostridia bacterium]|nr:UDP-N-acetylglucosamine 1-carboxyvinyltransferase [Clostridia bacterium]
MEKYVINGGRSLSGKLKIESAKNAVLPILAASILTDEEVVIMSCPKIKDVLNMIKILNHLGVKTEFCQDNLVIDSSGLNSYTLPLSLTGELRSSVFMMGSLLSRVRKARLSYPGGCDIGLRPLDIHINALTDLGVSVTEVCGQLICTADKIRGREIYLDYPSVGATENAMLTAVLAEGKTEIHNPAKEPEIIDLMNFLNSMGAKVFGAGTSTIFIEGVKRLHGTCYKPISDRIECGTYLIATAITGGEIELYNCNAKNISSLIHKLCDNTCKITVKNDIIHLKGGSVRKSFSLETGPYPSFPTDLQSQTMSLATVSEGTSVITETVFETRYNHVPELIKMGASITVKNSTAIINGVKNLHGACVTAKDLRGGASLVLAGLNAEGKTVVSDVRHIERGYLNFDEKLRALGADIKRKN